MTKFLEILFEHIREFVGFTNEVLNRSKQNHSGRLLRILEEVFKETKIDLKLEGLFKEFTISYGRGTIKFGITVDAIAVVLDINDIIKNLKGNKINSISLPYNCKKSAEGMKRFVDLFVNSYSERNFFPII